MSVERITGKKIRQDLANIFNLKKGVFYTLWELFKSPGKTVMRYLKEDRDPFINSFRLLVLVTTIYSFVAIKTGVMDMSLNEGIQMNATDADSEQAQMIASEGQKMVVDLYKEYLNIFAFLSIPVIALFTKMFFRKSDLNYAEHVTAQALLGSVVTVISLVLVPLAFVSIKGFSMISIVIMLLYQSLYVWAISTKKNVWTIVKGIFSYLIAYLIYMVLFMLAIGIYVGIMLADKL